MQEQRTCPCGQEFTATHHKQKYCPDCQEARFNAKHPLKTCKSCGCETRSMGRNDSVCWECRQKLEEAKRIARRKEAQARHPNLSPECAEYLEEWKKLPPYQQQRHYMIILDWIVDRLLEKYGEEQSPANTNPEEEPHADQDAIDAEFRTIMDSVNWGEA